MKGYLPQQTICDYCHRDVFEIDALWYEGKPYHEGHFKLYLVNELRQYEKKKMLGTLTISEANRYKEFLDMYEIERRSVSPVKLSKHTNPETPRFFGQSPLSKHSVELKQLRAKENLKEITQNSNEKQPLVSDGKTTEIIAFGDAIK